MVKNGVNLLLMRLLFIYMLQVILFQVRLIVDMLADEGL
jgi:hypothetical protein